MYRAVLDTCALVPGLQRDFLLQLATEEAYAPIWGSGILFELDYVLAGMHAKRGVAHGNEEATSPLRPDEAGVPGIGNRCAEDRDYVYNLNDPDDGHVAHAAIIGKADAIVTDDTRAGFRTAASLAEANVEIVYPNQFAANTVSARPQAGVRALVEMSKRRRNPAQSPAEILDELVERYDMTETADVLRPLLETGHTP